MSGAEPYIPPMTSIQQYNLKCKCGCDKASHFWDKNGSGNCLVMRCDCAEFKDPKEDGPYRKQRNFVEHNGPQTPKFPW